MGQGFSYQKQEEKVQKEMSASLATFSITINSKSSDLSLNI